MHCLRSIALIRPTSKVINNGVEIQLTTNGIAITASGFEFSGCLASVTISKSVIARSNIIQAEIVAIVLELNILLKKSTGLPYPRQSLSKIEGY